MTARKKKAAKPRALRVTSTNVNARFGFDFQLELPEDKRGFNTTATYDSDDQYDDPSLVVRNGCHVDSLEEVLGHYGKTFDEYYSNGGGGDAEYRREAIRRIKFVHKEGTKLLAKFAKLQKAIEDLEE